MDAPFPTTGGVARLRIEARMHGSYRNECEAHLSKRWSGRVPTSCLLSGNLCLIADIAQR